MGQCHVILGPRVLIILTLIYLLKYDLVEMTTDIILLCVRDQFSPLK